MGVPNKSLTQGVVSNNQGSGFFGTLHMLKGQARAMFSDMKLRGDTKLLLLGDVPVPGLEVEQKNRGVRGMIIVCHLRVL